MTNALHNARRKVMAVLAAPLLLGAFSASVAAPGDSVHGQMDHKQTFYSDPAKTVQVGYTLYWCDGDIDSTGYETEPRLFITGSALLGMGIWKDGASL